MGDPLPTLFSESTPALQILLKIPPQVFVLLVLCTVGLATGLQDIPRLDCENNEEDGLLCYDKLEGRYKKGECPVKSKKGG